MVDHHDSYTHNLVHLVAGVTGALPALVQHDASTTDQLASYDAIVLSPGPGHPDEHDWSLFSLGLPVLGVCLGMQAIVMAYGGVVDRVRPGHGAEAVVNHDGDGLFAGVPDPFRAIRYHSLAAVTLPDALRRTAVDERTGLTMAVAHRSLPIVGVQFHPESILTEHGARLVANFLELV